MDKKVQVLVVEDDEFVLDAVMEILKVSGFLVAGASDGWAGLKKYDAENFDIILTDIIMPDMEGIEFIKAVSKRKRNTPIIVMSGNHMGLQFLDSARIFGAKATLQKPFHPKMLVQTIEWVLEGWEEGKERIGE